MAGDPHGAAYIARLVALHAPVVRRRWLVLRLRYCSVCPGRVRYRRCPAIRWVKAAQGRRHGLGWPA